MPKTQMNNAFSEANEAWRKRAERGLNWIVNRESQKRHTYFQRMKDSFIDVFVTKGQGNVTITKQKKHYYEKRRQKNSRKTTHRGLYGLDFHKIPRHKKDVINLQEIIDPSGVNTYGDGSRGLLDSAELIFNAEETRLKIIVRSRATMQPYNKHYPRKAKAYYLLHGWGPESDKDKRRMVGRNFLKYYVDNVDADKYINPIITRLALYGNLFIDGKTKERENIFGHTTLVTIYKGAGRKPSNDYSKYVIAHIDF